MLARAGHFTPDGQARAIAASYAYRHVSLLRPAFYLLNGTSWTPRIFMSFMPLPNDTPPGHFLGVAAHDRVYKAAYASACRCHSLSHMPHTHDCSRKFSANAARGDELIMMMYHL